MLPAPQRWPEVLNGEVEIRFLRAFAVCALRGYRRVRRVLEVRSTLEPCSRVVLL